MSSKRNGPPENDVTREQVRMRYARIAGQGGCGTPAGSNAGECCGSSSEPCCGDSSQARALGYSRADLESLPEGANLGLGCGNPTAILALRPRQVVLDLGSGAGIDCFLASRRVGSNGHVIGVDMTPEMVAKARESARTGHLTNVDFRLGEIEHLPVADGTVDVVISNCVINLAPEKGPVYREAYRVLRAGGRLAISDVVATRPIRREDRSNPALWSSCSSGALEVKTVRALLRRAGFRDIRVVLKRRTETPPSLRGQADLGVVPADILATKPYG